MKIYFDESGQSGCVLRKDDLLNFRKQPIFAVGALVLPSEKSEEMLVKKYHRFKEKFMITDEIKGTDLLKREMNEALHYFLDNFLNCKDFFVILYDKRFYLSTLLLQGLLGRIYQQEIPLHFYQQADFLSHQNDDFFLEYLKYIEKPSPEGFKMYLKFLVGYNYRELGVSENAVIEIAKRILDNHKEEDFCNDLMTFGWYENPNHTNVINLNALSEIIYSIKDSLKAKNKEVQYIHDNIFEFEDIFKTELKECGIDVSFADSKLIEPLQVVDNVVSITRHAYDKMIKHINDKQQWNEEFEWDMKLASKVMRRLSVNRINFTVPISDWSASLCMMEMFAPKYPKNLRNNFVFNPKYLENMGRIYQSLMVSFKSDDEVQELLKR